METDRSEIYQFPLIIYVYIIMIYSLLGKQQNKNMEEKIDMN